MERRPGQSLESLGAVVAFIEDESDVLARLSQIAVAMGQLFGDGTEFDTIVDITGVDGVEQRHVKIGADQ
jgi:hypothetical protein